MSQNTQIGHFAVDINNQRFEFKPSLRAMSRLADAVELMQIYKALHSRYTKSTTLISMSQDVLLTCVDKPKDFERYTVGVSYAKDHRGKPHFKSKLAISINDQIQVAAALMRHGIAGVNRPKNSLQGEGVPMKEFDVYRFVADAKHHFGVSLTEAWEMTMSEFYYHLAAAFPPTGKEPDIDAHKAAMEQDKALYDKAMAAFKAVNNE